MPSKKRCRFTQIDAKPTLGLAPAPASSDDVLLLLKFAAHASPGDADLLAHLAQMGTLFPREMLGAFRAFRKKQLGDN